jgi:hypothetical protein
MVTVISSASAQVVAPPPPAEYDAVIRYRIRAARNERIRQYLELTRFLDQAGFQRNPTETDDAVDPSAERLEGKLPSAAVRLVLTDPHVRTLLLTPTGFAWPDTVDARLPVTIDIVGGLPFDRQQLLHEQTADRLRQMGFIENIGYDPRGFTRLVGSMPADQIPLLIADLRWQPGGWLSPETNPDALPEPIRSVDPLRVVTVVPLPAGISAVADAVTPKVDPALVKVGPELRALLAQEDAAANLIRMEAVLFDPPAREDLAWRTWIRSGGLATIEGHAGQIVTVLAPVSMAKEFARMPQVATVRLPALATPAIPSGGPINAGNPMAATNIDALHAQGVRGQGARIAIVDSDFAGVQRAIGRSLPKAKMLDLTAERNPSLEPDPITGDRPGRGTLAALAAVRAAPDAELVLVRVDAAAPYQVLNVARAVAGEVFRTEALTVRYTELLLDNERLRQARAKLNADRKELMDNFSADEETQKRRLELQQRLIRQDKEERDYAGRLARFVDLEQSFMELRFVQAVACNLNWSIGLPVDGTGPLARYIDGPARFNERPKKLGPVTWLQAAGDTHGQTWAAPLWDADNNGVMEFAQKSFPIPAGKWSRELNFIGWQTHEGPWYADLPAGTKLRIALQWTEAHDPTAPVEPSRYRTPLTNLQPMLLRQRDPSGTKLPSDDMVVVARSAELPMMIGRAANFATFEHIVEFTIDEPGRYAVRIEGAAAASTAPPGTPMVPAARRVGEVYSRLNIDVADAKSQEIGRPIFIDYRPLAGGMASPSDAASVVVVGAVDAQGRPQPYGARGSAPSLSLIARPTVAMFDEFHLGNYTARGTGTANGFTAGTIAAMLSGGAPGSSDLRWLQVPAGGLLRVPSVWLDQRTQTTGLRERASYWR